MQHPKRLWGMGEVRSMKTFRTHLKTKLKDKAFKKAYNDIDAIKKATECNDIAQSVIDREKGNK